MGLHPPIRMRGVLFALTGGVLAHVVRLPLEECRVINLDIQQETNVVGKSADSKPKRTLVRFAPCKISIANIGCDLLTFPLRTGKVQFIVTVLYHCPCAFNCRCTSALYSSDCSRYSSKSAVSEISLSVTTFNRFQTCHNCQSKTAGKPISRTVLITCTISTQNRPSCVL